MALAERPTSSTPATPRKRPRLRRRAPERPVAPAKPVETDRVEPLDEIDRGDGIRLLLADVRVAGLLLNETRYRALEAIGVRRDDANFATVIIALMLAETLEENRKRLLAQPTMPPLSDSTMGLAFVREGIYALAGPSARDTPLVGTLVSLALAAAVARPAVRAASHGIRDSSRRMHTAFNHRYGHLVAHGRRHARRVRDVAQSVKTDATGRG
jgi:hypothetical protein